ncbi:MAG: hypothetical protein HZB39_16420 [Planctomycetes bacterium]|nr:hypothetical protein [Planctomycetota bacterium]
MGKRSASGDEQVAVVEALAVPGAIHVTQGEQLLALLVELEDAVLGELRDDREAPLRARGDAELDARDALHRHDRGAEAGDEEGEHVRTQSADVREEALAVDEIHPGIDVVVVERRRRSLEQHARDRRDVDPLLSAAGGHEGDLLDIHRAQFAVAHGAVAHPQPIDDRRCADQSVDAGIGRDALHIAAGHAHRAEGRIRHDDGLRVEGHERADEQRALDQEHARRVGRHRDGIAELERLALGERAFGDVESGDRIGEPHAAARDGDEVAGQFFACREHRPHGNTTVPRRRQWHSRQGAHRGDDARIGSRQPRDRCRGVIAQREVAQESDGLARAQGTLGREQTLRDLQRPRRAEHAEPRERRATDARPRRFAFDARHEQRRGFVVTDAAECAQSTLDDQRIGVGQRTHERAIERLAAREVRGGHHESAQEAQLLLRLLRSGRGDRREDPLGAHLLFVGRAALRPLLDLLERAPADLDQRAFGVLACEPAFVGELVEEALDLEAVFAVVAVDRGGDRGTRGLAHRDQRPDLTQAPDETVVLEARNPHAQLLDAKTLLVGSILRDESRAEGADQDGARGAHSSVRLGHRVRGTEGRGVDGRHRRQANRRRRRRPLAGPDEGT